MSEFSMTMIWVIVLISCSISCAEYDACCYFDNKITNQWLNEDDHRREMFCLKMLVPFCNIVVLIKIINDYRLAHNLDYQQGIDGTIENFLKETSNYV